jgi:hypothetical protein
MLLFVNSKYMELKKFYVFANVQDDHRRPM